MQRYIMLHGFNVGDKGKNTVDRIVPYLDKYVSHLDYGNFSIMDVVKDNPKVAGTLAAMSNSLDIPIGHSNGCAIIAEACMQGAKFETVVLINPALRKEFKFPDTVKKIIIYHTAYDKPVWWSKILRYCPPFVFFRDFLWGEMGRTGSTHSNDPRYVNVDVTERAGKSNAHCGMFNTVANIKWIANDINERTK